MAESILSLQEYGIAFGDRLILSSVSLDIPERGVFVLLGPAGTGKSTLLRTLAGINDAAPSMRTWGEVWYAGKPLNNVERPSLVAQNARLMMADVLENIMYGLPERESLERSQQLDVARRLLVQAGLADLVDKLDESVVNLPLAQQRHLAILRTAASSPRLLFIDEPTTGLSEDEAQNLISYIKQEAERRAVLVVVHNLKQARSLGGITALLAGGWVQESKATETFFNSPESPAAQSWVRSGSCSVPSPDAQPEHLEPDSPELSSRPRVPEAASHYVSDSFGPRNFLWLKKGILAGTPRPGIVTELEYDLTALQRVGVTVLVSLTQKPVEPTDLQAYGIKGKWFPIVDMQAPEIDKAMDFCAEMEALMQSGEVIALHCKAGLGRTGTMLAAQLIWEGYSALEALETARRIEPRWVQSEVQVSFLEEFADAVADSDKLTAASGG